MHDDAPTNPPEFVSPPVLARPAGPPLARPVPARPQPLELRGLSPRDALLDLAIVLLVLLVGPMGVGLLAAWWMPDAASWLPSAIEDEALPLLVGEKWIDALLALGVLTYFVLRHRLAPAGFGLHARRPGVQALWALPTLGGIYAVIIGTSVVVALLWAFLPGVEEDLEHRVRFFDELPVRTLWGSVLLMIPVAIHEEVLFRGLLVPLLRRAGLPWSVAIVLPAAVFGLLHFPQGALGIIQIFLLGVVFGLFFVWSRSLIAVVLAHFVFNVLQLQLARALPWVEQAAEQLQQS